MTKGEPLPRDQILDLWQHGLTAPEIADRLTIARSLSVTNLIYDARRRGDPRAVKRAPQQKQQQAAYPPPQHGYKTECRRVSGMTVTLSAGEKETANG